ncbi:MAG TPA: thrombospondin type 3 repeat-containing protein [Polyangiaceae bacterium]
MNLTKRPLLFALTILAVLGWSRGAHAKRQYPAMIAKDLALAYLVPCSTCHLKGNVGAGTAGTPFALSLRDRGLSGEESTLTSALSRLEADDVDSDGDGIPDVTELRSGSDPNSSANASIVNAQEPGYGCGGSAPRGTPDAGKAFVGLAGFGWLLRRRRRGWS